MTLDLTAPEGAERLRALIAGADVFVESFRPGVADRLGFGYQRIHREQPATIYCSITGYGQDGPWRDRPGFDCLVAAKLGVMAEQTGRRPGPTFLGHPNLGYGTAFLASIGIARALRARHLTGRGPARRHLAARQRAWPRAPMNWWWNEHDVSYLARSGTEQGFGRNRIITDLFLCGDGEYLMIHTGGEGGFKRTMDILGVGRRGQGHRGPGDGGAPRRRRVPRRPPARPRGLRLPSSRRVGEAVPRGRPGRPAGAAPDRGPARRAGAVRRRGRRAPRPVRAAAAPGRPGREVRGLAAGAPGAGAGRRSRRSRGSTSSSRRAPPRGGRGGRASHRRPRAGRGLRVLDFSSFFATAYGAKLLERPRRRRHQGRDARRATRCARCPTCSRPATAASGTSPSTSSRPPGARSSPASSPPPTW